MGRKSINYISIPVEVNRPIQPNQNHMHLTAMKSEYKDCFEIYFLALLISRSSVSKYILLLSQYVPVCSIQGLAHVKIVN